MPCLLANHGVIATGADIAAAFKLAQQVEELARQFMISQQAGTPVLLDSDEMQINLERFQCYENQG